MRVGALRIAARTFRNTVIELADLGLLLSFDYASYWAAVAATDSRNWFANRCCCRNGASFSCVVIPSLRISIAIVLIKLRSVRSGTIPSGGFFRLRRLTSG